MPRPIMPVKAGAGAGAVVTRLCARPVPTPPKPGAVAKVDAAAATEAEKAEGRAGGAMPTASALL